MIVIHKNVHLYMEKATSYLYLVHGLLTTYGNIHLPLFKYVKRVYIPTAVFVHENVCCTRRMHVCVRRGHYNSNTGIIVL